MTKTIIHSFHIFCSLDSASATAFMIFIQALKCAFTSWPIVYSCAFSRFGELTYVETTIFVGGDGDTLGKIFSEDMGGALMWLFRLQSLSRHFSWHCSSAQVMIHWQ